MNNMIMRTVPVTAEYKPLSAVSLIGTVTISALPSNIGDVFFRGDDGSDVAWVRGEWHPVVRVDLSEIFIKGTPGDAVTLIGGTWG